MAVVPAKAGTHFSDSAHFPNGSRRAPGSKELGEGMSDTAVAERADAGASDDPASRPVVTLQPGGHRRAEGGHPWIYSNEIAMDAAAKALPAGTLVTLRRADERPFG